MLFNLRQSEEKAFRVTVSNQEALCCPLQLCAPRAFLADRSFETFANAASDGELARELLEMVEMHQQLIELALCATAYAKAQFEGTFEATPTQ